MAEMAHAGEHHGDAVFIRRIKHFLITHRAAGVDNRFDALLGNHINAALRAAMRVESTRLIWPAPMP